MILEQSRSSGMQCNMYVCTMCMPVFDILGILQSSPSNLSSQAHVNVLGLQVPLTQTGSQTGEWNNETISLCHYTQHHMTHMFVFTV